VHCTPPQARGVDQGCAKTVFATRGAHFAGYRVIREPMPVYTDSVTGYLVTDIDNRIDNMISWSLKTSIKHTQCYTIEHSRSRQRTFAPYSLC
jgi:hypothetical protein